MIKLENAQVTGWEAAIRGMRNPMNSWKRSDSFFHSHYDVESETDISVDINGNKKTTWSSCLPDYEIGPNDYDLMTRLASSGSVHAKYRRMITVYVDITAPLYWWKEFDTYKVGTVANSCSTMHKIHAKKFTLDDFSHEHLYKSEELELLEKIIEMLNDDRSLYLDSNKKEDWWQMIQLLPSSYNQKRTVMLNYEVLANIYGHRKDHKLDEWRNFCSWIEGLPYSTIITAKKKESEKPAESPITYEQIYHEFLKGFPDLAGDVTDYRPGDKAYTILVYTRNNGLLLYDWKKNQCLLNVMDSWMKD